MADRSARLRSVLARLGACQAEVADVGEAGVARLLAMAALEIRLRLHNMGDAELRAISDAFDDNGCEQSDQPGASLKSSGDRS